MNYIVLELFPEPYVVQTIEGTPWIVEDLNLAKQQAAECQQGMVVPLDTNLIDTIEECITHGVGFLLLKYIQSNE